MGITFPQVGWGCVAQPRTTPVLLLEYPTSICVSEFRGVYCRLMPIFTASILRPTPQPLPSPSSPPRACAPLHAGSPPPGSSSAVLGSFSEFPQHRLGPGAGNTS